MSQNNFVSTINTSKAKAYIYDKTYLNQCCLKGKELLKISIISLDNQAKKSKAIVLPAKANTSKSD